MVELVDTPDLGSGAERRVSSSLIRRTKQQNKTEGLTFQDLALQVTVFYGKW